MKKFALVLMVLLAIGGMAFAAPKDKGKGKGSDTAVVTPYVDKGEFLVNVGIGWGGLTGGAEMTLARIDIGGVIPLTFGAAARAFVDPGIFYTTYSDLTFGVGGFGTVHCGFKSLDLPSGFGWFSDCDVYVGLGVGLASMVADASWKGTYDKFSPGIGISTFEGASYYFNDKFAINFEYGYIGKVKYSYTYPGYSYDYSWPVYYGSVGVIFKL